MINPNTYVYCTHCKHFDFVKVYTSRDIGYEPFCNNESKCDFTDFEDSRPYNERPCYEVEELSDKIMAVLDGI